MARSDLLINLVRAGASGNRLLFRKTVEALIAEERTKQHDILATRIAEALEQSAISPTGGNGPGVRSTPNGSVEDLFYEFAPRRKFEDLILVDGTKTICSELVEEHHRADLLKSHNLLPRHKVLLIGPPGNGKTSLAEAIADALMVPLIVARYEGLIGSYLGETASRLRKLFTHIRTRACVLFFDEFDTLGKERGDQHETGEIKRVVSSLLMQIDDLPSYVCVVTATNHPELLDRAVWRRFQVRIELPAPTRSQVAEYFDYTTKRLNVDLKYSTRTLADRLHGLSFAELEDFLSDVIRRYVLSLPDADLRKIIASHLRVWSTRINKKKAGTSGL